MAEGNDPGSDKAPTSEFGAIMASIGPVELADRILASPLEDLGSEGMPIGKIPSLRIDRVMLDGFGPHDGPNVLDLEDGFTLITGRNGTGKTHIILGIHWCLFGERGSLDPWMSEVDPMGKDLVNWGRSGSGDPRMRVDVDLTWNGERFTVSRELKGQKERFRVIRPGDPQAEEMDSLPGGLDPGVMAYLLFQGEAVMFLASEDPFLPEGNLRSVLSKLSGADRSLHASDMLISAREVLIERLRGLYQASAPKESEFSTLRSRLSDVEDCIEGTRSRIEILAKDRKRAMASYRHKLRSLSERGTLNRLMREEAVAKARMPMMNERISSFLASAGREVLRSMTERAMDICASEREERTRRRMKVGALEAQASIVRSILERERCMCGTSVGRSGIGKERIESLLTRLEAGKAELSLSITEPIWSSDQVMEGARRCLAASRQTRREFLDLVKEYRSTRSTLERIAMKAGIESEPMEDLISAVREMENKTTLHQREREELKRLVMERSDLRSAARRLESELAESWGVQGGEGGYTQRIEAIDRTVEALQRSSAEKMGSLRAEVEERANITLSRLDPDSRLGQIKVHETNYRIGRAFGEGCMQRVLTMPYLSAGERELTALSVLTSIPGISGGMLVLDSPFPYIDIDKRRRIIEGLPEISTRVLISLPEGSMSEKEMEKAREVWLAKGLSFRHYVLEIEGQGSILKLYGGAGG
ncbi:MAG: AAA family ATPase [Candidatus Thermoplasmatota archaeon]|nr:AAA family ATPase [Candidatus Thermoplasmatota archaeon]